MRQLGLFGHRTEGLWAGAEGTVGGPMVDETGPIDCVCKVPYSFLKYDTILINSEVRSFLIYHTHDTLIPGGHKADRKPC